MEEKSLKIVSDKSADKTLNKEQRRFNSLVNQISLLRAEIALMKELDLELRRLGDERVKPSDEKVNNALREWIFVLHNHPGKLKLSQKMTEKFALIMLEEIEPVLTHYTAQEDVDLQELYTHYEGKGRSFAEIQVEKMMEDEEMEKEFEAFFNTFATAESQEEADTILKESRQENTKQTRRKTQSQQAAEEKRQAAALSVKKTTKEIYLDLVRNFHPDKEPDELKREEKTELMKQITAAYQDDDYLKLLELQMNLLASRNNVFADFDNAQLKYFNKLLQQQVSELKGEFLFSSPEVNGNIYGYLYDPERKQMLRNIEQLIRANKQALKDIDGNMGLIRDGKMFKEYVRDYQFDEFW